MRERVKSTPDDDLILLDETADATDRENSASRLAFDGFFDLLRPVLNKWLDHSEFLLRDRAITFLLGRLGDEEYFKKGVQMLHGDSSWIVRKSSSESLKKFNRDFIEGKNFKSQIIKELLFSLLNDQEKEVQAKSYQGLHEIIIGENWENYDEIDYFDHNRDVDWSLLQPYLEKFNLEKPKQT